jgi:hypothetical protein
MYPTTVAAVGDPHAGFSRTAVLVLFCFAVGLFVVGLFLDGSGGGALTGAGFGLAAVVTLFSCVNASRR